ncbi:hypothetical protein Tco_0880066 [Tanacetum coccineum]
MASGHEVKLKIQDQAVETTSETLVTPFGALNDDVRIYCDAVWINRKKEALETLAWRQRRKTCDAVAA